MKRISSLIIPSASVQGIGARLVPDSSPHSTSGARSVLPQAALEMAVAMALVFAFAAILPAQDELTYVKKESREATRQASLAASGAVRWPAAWHLIGPFDNTDGRAQETAYPPEQEIKLDATYEGKGETAHGARDSANGLKSAWRDSRPRTNAPVLPLYRRVKSPRTMRECRCRSAARIASSPG